MNIVDLNKYLNQVLKNLNQLDKTQKDKLNKFLSQIGKLIKVKPQSMKNINLQLPFKLENLQPKTKNQNQNYLKKYPGKKVISFCIWGKTRLYHYGLWENAMLLPKIFPGWEMVIYYTQTADMEVLNELKKLPYVTLHFINIKNGSQNGMLRFLAGFNPEYDIVISRDADARLLQRDAEAVKEWLNSNKDFHIMRDHPANNSLIMAGMWGARNKILCHPEIEEQFWKYIKNPEYKKWGNDQRYLNKYIYPRVINTSIVHSIFYRPESFAKPFPKTAYPRHRGFVGMTSRYFPHSKKKFNIPTDFKGDKKREL